MTVRELYKRIIKETKNDDSVWDLQVRIVASSLKYDASINAPAADVKTMLSAFEILDYEVK